MGLDCASLRRTSLLTRATASGALAWLTWTLLACGARSTLEPGETTATDGGGGSGGLPIPTVTTSTAATSNSSTSTGGGGGAGGAPPACLDPPLPYSLAIPQSGAAEHPASVVDGEGNLYVLAAYSGGPDLGPSATADPGEEGMLLARLDPCGVPTFIRPMRGASLGTTRGGVLVGDRLIFAGYHTGEVDFGTGPISANGGTLGFIAAFSLEGETLWARTLESSGIGKLAAVRAIAADDNTVYVTGAFEESVDFGDAVRSSLGEEDIFLARLDASTGETVWSTTYGTAGYEEGLALAVTGTGEVCLGTAGSQKTQWGGSFPSSAAIVSLARDDGEVLSALAIGSATASAMTAVGDDCVVVGGYTGAVFLGSISLPTAVDGWNGFATRVGPGASVKWARPFGPGFGMLSATLADTTGTNLLVGGTLMGGWTFEDGTVLGDQVTAANVLYLLALDLETGAFTKGRTFDGAISHGVRAIHSSSDGSILVSGVLEGSGLDLGQGSLGVEGEETVFAARLDWE